MAWGEEKKRKRKKSAVFNIQHHQQYGNVNYEKVQNNIERNEGDKHVL